MSIDWLRSKPGVTAPIVGANRPQQLLDAVGSLDRRLPAAAIDRLDEVSAFRRSRASLET